MKSHLSIWTAVAIFFTTGCKSDQNEPAAAQPPDEVSGVVTSAGQPDQGASGRQNTKFQTGVGHVADGNVVGEDGPGDDLPEEESPQGDSNGEHRPGSCEDLGAEMHTPPSSGASDITPPVLTGVRFSSDVYNAGDAGAIIFQATDDISGITQFQSGCWGVNYDGKNSSIHPCGYVWKFPDGSYCLNFEINPWSPQGTHKLAWINLNDAAGQSSNYDGSAGMQYAGTSIPVAVMYVKSDTPDETPPVLQAISFGAASYNAPATGSVLFTATDDVSGIADFQSGCWGLESLSGLTRLHPCGTITHVTGDQYSVSFDIGEFVQNGTYKLLDFELGDKAGNSRRYSSNGGVYEGTSIPVISLTVNNMTPDVTAPSVSEVGFSAATFTRGSTGSVIYKATDAVAGIAEFQSGCWGLESASGNSRLNPCGVVTSLGGDEYALSFDIGPFVETGTYYLKGFSVGDKAGNQISFTADGGLAFYEGSAIPVASMTVVD